MTPSRTLLTPWFKILEKSNIFNSRVLEEDCNAEHAETAEVEDFLQKHHSDKRCCASSSLRAFVPLWFFLELDGETAGDGARHVIKEGAFVVSVCDAVCILVQQILDGKEKFYFRLREDVDRNSLSNFHIDR